jgi:hypothetical protein
MAFASHVTTIRSQADGDRASRLTVGYSVFSGRSRSCGYTTIIITCLLNAHSSASVVVACTTLLMYGLLKPQTSPRELLGIQLGTIDPRLFISPFSTRQAQSGFLGNNFIANSPQIILSILYYSINRIYTCFWFNEEFSTYAVKRKGLRVSRVPTGFQRTTYNLQLPYRYIIPFMSMSSLLHWLVSQCIFVATYTGANIYGTKDSSKFTGDNAVFSCVYSPRAILATTCVALLMVGALVGISSWEFKSAMPLTGTCSASISARCHDIADESCSNATWMPVKWGALSPPDLNDDDGFVGHCTFSAGEVYMPQDGKKYI